MMKRRVFLGSAAAAAAAFLVNGRVSAAPRAIKLVIYKSPTCGCCSKWVERARNSGFETEVHDVEDIDAIKNKHNVPAELRSCHTALANGYIFEGHVPIDVVNQLLKEKPKVLGIAVPGMPIGSEGMEMGTRKDPYKVIAFDRTGKTTIYAQR